MTTYNSYQDAKIANPEGNIYKSPGTPRVFTATTNSQLWFKCNPDDHCMTVEQFLNDDHRFVNGDIFYNKKHDSVVTVGKMNITEGLSNIAQNIDKECYILRAAALENKMNIDKLETQSEGKPNQYESVAKDLPKKRVKYDYERVDFVEHWEYFKLMSEEGDLYVNCTDLSYEGFGGDNINLANALHDGSCIYRRIETEIDERQEFIATAFSLDGVNQHPISVELVGKMYDSGKFKLVEGE